MVEELDISLVERQRCATELCSAWKKWIGGTPLEQPPYSPDLAPCDFWAFPTLKSELWGSFWSLRQTVSITFSRSGRAHPPSYPMGTRGSFPGGRAARARDWPLASVLCRGRGVSGAVPHSPNTPSWHGARLRHMEAWVEPCKECIACQGRYFENETFTAPPQSPDSE
jgi:hypothetical protein